MVYKNLITNGRELEGDLLRQRRDFYAISFGLVLFHLAGGRMNGDATLSSLPVHLARPDVLYWAAWVSFAYFGLRYWVLDPGSIDRFKEEWERQTQASQTYRRLLSGLAKSLGDVYHRETWETCLRVGYRPATSAVLNEAGTDLSELRHVQTGKKPPVPQQRIPNSLPKLSPDQRYKLWSAHLAGFFRAVFLERTATDLLLPYFVGVAAIAIALFLALNCSSWSLTSGRSGTEAHSVVAATARWTSQAPQAGFAAPCTP